MTAPELSVIIVNYNVREFLRQALRSIQQAVSDIPAEIIVVDNASVDGSADMVRKDFPEVRLIENRQNVGFGRANNQAIALAQGKVLAFVNPDTVVQEDTFSVLLRFLKEHPEAGMVGCKILNPDGSLQLACRRSFPTPWVAFTKLVGLSRLFPRSRLFGRYNLTFLDPDQTAPVDAISGSFMMIRREVLERAGSFDERFFMYGEDLDLCYRVRKAGWEIYYVPETQIVHYKGASSSKAGLDTLLLFYRAMLQFVRKHFRGRYRFLPQWFLYVGIATRGTLSFFHRFFLRLRMPLIDLFFLQVALALALLLRFGSLIHWRSYLLVTAIYSTIWLLNFYFFDLYEHRKFSGSHAASAVLAGLVINSTITYFAKEFAFSRLVVLLQGGLNLLFIPGWRILVRWLALHSPGSFFERLKRRYFRKRAILVGSASSLAGLYRKIQAQADDTVEVVGLVSTAGKPEQIESGGSLPVLQSADRLPAAIRELDANEVIFSSSSLSYGTILSWISELSPSGVDFKIASDQFDVIIGSGSVEYLGELSLVDVEYRLAHARYRALKRGLDLSLAVIGLLAVIPLWFLLHLLGYRLRRGEVFWPASGTAETGNEKWNRKNVWLMTKKERLPQFWLEKSPLLLQVLSGSLSMVGVPVAFRKEELNPAFRGIRMKPGLVPFADVDRGRPREEQAAQRAAILYMKRYSPWLDLEILAKHLLKR